MINKSKTMQFALRTRSHKMERKKKAGEAVLGPAGCRSLRLTELKKREERVDTAFPTVSALRRV
jgi:hypothetical protein